MITDCDRQAAEALRVILADLTGFWHRPGDDGPLCQALSRHREESERRLLGKLLPWIGGDGSGDGEVSAPIADRALPTTVAAFAELKHVGPLMPARVRPSGA